MNPKSSTKSKVLHLLQSEQGNFISGESIASELEISRTAVWKAINSLRQDGLKIESVTNKGYCLTRRIDVLSRDAINYHIKQITQSANGWSDLKDLHIDVFDAVDSTNNVCIKRASSETQGHNRNSVYIAVSGAQTAGKGRKGRSFFSPGNTGLYMSILVRPEGITVDEAVKFTTIAAVAVCEAVEAVSGIEASIKWVNDVYARDRKICGILTEASFNPEGGTLDYAVVGIGVNVYEPDGGFPEDIRDRAGSLAGPAAKQAGAGDANSDKRVTPETILENGGRSSLAAEILVRFLTYFEDEIVAENADRGEPRRPRYTHEYRRRCFVTGHTVDVLTAGQNPKRAYVLGVDDCCRLQVRYEDDSEDVLNSGEISIRL